MLLSLSLLSILLLLVNGVPSADLSSDKRVSRRQTQFTKTYKSNHPPIIETYDKIPVTVVYDDEEVIRVNNKNEEKDDVIDGEVSVNHPPERGLYTLPEGDDSKEKLNSKPRSRSIKIPVNEPEVTKPNVKLSPETETRAVIKPRRRVQKVRKVKVNKSQLDIYDTEPERTKIEEDQKEATQTTVSTRREESSSRAPQIFKPRTGGRDPVVPIVESESYVFSHSGDFHYSYEGGDGTKAYERGELRSSIGGSGSAVEGNFSYKDKEGNDISLTYTADENGYRPVGAHLPTPPPVPIAIQRALAYLATKTTPEPITERIRTLKKKDEK